MYLSHCLPCCRRLHQHLRSWMVVLDRMNAVACLTQCISREYALILYPQPGRRFAVCRNTAVGYTLPKPPGRYNTTAHHCYKRLLYNTFWQHQGATIHQHTHCAYTHTLHATPRPPPEHATLPARGSTLCLHSLVPCMFTLQKSE